MNREFIEAIDELAKEKEVSTEVILEAIEAALLSAYKKHYGSNNNVRVDIDRDTGEITIYMRRTVVETLAEINSDNTEIHIEDAQEIDPRYEAGDIVETVVRPRDFGRIAAQTAKQVVVQQIREAERSIVYEDYINRVSEIAVGIIQRVSNDTVYINLGKTEGILSRAEQVPGETYTVNSRIKVYIMDVRNTTKGPQIFLSRSHPGFVKRLFELEVPEIYDGLVEIKSISREAGSRTKMAVWSANENIDAVGACVGTRGTRVQAVVDEIFGEKIDIILWNEDPQILISSALSPAKTEKVLINVAERMAMVVVPDQQLSLAIGKEGQNVRLAARLTGWKIDIKSHSKYEEGLEYGEFSEYTEFPDDSYYKEEEEYYDDDYYDDDEYYDDDYDEEYDDYEEGDYDDEDYDDDYEEGEYSDEEYDDYEDEDYDEDAEYADDEEYDDEAYDDEDYEDYDEEYDDYEDGDYEEGDYEEGEYSDEEYSE